MPSAKAKDVEMHRFPDQQGGSASVAHTDQDTHDHKHPLDWREINRVLFVGVAAGVIWFLGAVPNLSLPKMLSGANAFEINDIQ